MDTYDVLAAVRELVNDPPTLDSIDWTDVDRYRVEVASWYDNDVRARFDAYNVDRFPAWIERADR